MVTGRARRRVVNGNVRAPRGLLNISIRREDRKPLQREAGIPIAFSPDKISTRVSKRDIVSCSQRFQLSSSYIPLPVSADTTEATIYADSLSQQPCPPSSRALLTTRKASDSLRRVRSSMATLRS